MPQEHLASQAASSATCSQQLDGMAALHARIRQGSPGIAHQWLFRMTDLPEPGLEFVHWCRSSAGGCAVVVWGRPGTAGSDMDSADEEDELEPETVGALVVGCDAGSTPWTSSMPAEVELSTCCTGFSPQGDYCVTVSQTGTFSAEHRAYQPCEDADVPELLIRVFDVRQRSWLAARPAAGHASSYESVAFCEGPGPLVAVVHMWRGDESALLVFGVVEPYSRVITTDCLRCFHLLPGLRALVLRLPSQDDGSKWSLACMHLGPQSGDSAGLPAWVPFDVQSAPALAVAWRGCAVWVGLLVRGQQGSSLSVYSVTDLACRGTWTLAGHGAGHVLQVRRIVLHAKQQVILVQQQLGRGVATSVYRLEQYALGPLVFRVDSSIAHPIISADASFMLGFDESVMVVDMHTGSCLAQLAPESLCTGGCQLPTGESYLFLPALSWNSCNPSQLLVSFWVRTGMLFSVLQY